MNASRAPAAGVRTVLVVDEEPQVREAANAALRDRLAGVHAIGVRDGAQALAVLASRHVDVLVTDLQIADLEGIVGLSTAWSRRHPLSVIVVTEQRTPRLPVWARPELRFELLAKPIVVPDLVDIIERVLGPASRRPAQLGDEPIDPSFGAYLRSRPFPRKTTLSGLSPPLDPPPPPASMSPPSGPRRRPPSSVTPEERSTHMASIRESLQKLNSLDGFLAAALVDGDSGMVLGSEAAVVFDLEMAGAASSEVVRAKRKAITALALADDIEDILITLGKQYHLIRPMKDRPLVFFYLVLDRTKANLALSRLALSETSKSLSF